MEWRCLRSFVFKDHLLFQQILKAYGNNHLVYQNYDISTRDIVKTDDNHLLRYSRGNIGYHIFSLGSYTPTYRLRYY